MPSDSHVSESYHHLCWSCQREFNNPDDGISLNDTLERHICNSCWSLVPVTSRMVLGLLFRRIDEGGFGIQDLVEDAVERWPTIKRGGRPGVN